MSCLQIKKKKKKQLMSRGTDLPQKSTHTGSTDLERKPAVHGALCNLRVGPVLPTGSDLTPVIL